MNRFLSLIIVIAATFLLFSKTYAAPAQDKGFYVGATGGLNILDDSSLDSVVSLGVEYSPGYSFGGVFGYDFGMVRLDTEINYRDNNIDMIGISADGSTSALSFMVNGYYDIPTQMVIKPYLGGGVGFASVSINDANLPGIAPIADDSDTVLAYQLSTGVGYEINRSTTLNLGYRYFATGDPNLRDAGGTPFNTEYQSHEFNIGVRFLFN